LLDSEWVMYVLLSVVLDIIITILKVNAKNVLIHIYVIWHVILIYN